MMATMIMIAHTIITINISSKLGNYFFFAAQILHQPERTMLPATSVQEFGGRNMMQLPQRCSPCGVY